MTASNKTEKASGDTNTQCGKRGHDNMSATKCYHCTSLVAPQFSTCQATGPATYHACTHWQHNNQRPLIRLSSSHSPHSTVKLAHENFIHSDVHCSSVYIGYRLTVCATNTQGSPQK